MTFSPPLNLFGTKAFNDIYIHVHWMSLFVHRDCGDKRRLVRGSSAGLSAVTLFAPVNIIKLDYAGQRLAIVTLLHDLHYFLFDTPGGVVGNA